MLSHERGKVITVRGLINPSDLGGVLMHEHLHTDCYDWTTHQLIQQEQPITKERHAFLLKEAVPYIKMLGQFGCKTYVDATMPPWRAWPTMYVEASELSGTHILMATGFYREVELGKCWTRTQDDQIWPVVRYSEVEELEQMCVREIVEGIHDTGIRAGLIKLGSSQPRMTPLEVKCFQAASRAQKKTGVHLTTHCTEIAAETSQLTLLDLEGVDLSRVVIGHTLSHLIDKSIRKICMQWMKEGVTFLPTTMNVKNTLQRLRWQSFVDGIKEVFDAGLGDHLVLGNDWSFDSENAPFGPNPALPGPPYAYLFTDVLPLLRELGLTREMEIHMLVKNPQRILPVK